MNTFERYAPFIQDFIYAHEWENLRAIQVAAEYNLILNAANMVKNGVGLALCFDLDFVSSGLRFVPLSPTLETGTVLAWKKDQIGSPAAEEFLRQLRNADEAFLNEEKKYSTF